MTTLDEIDTTVQELRLEPHRHAFTHKLAHVVGLLGALPDSLAFRQTHGCCPGLFPVVREQK